MNKIIQLVLDWRTASEGQEELRGTTFNRVVGNV